MSKTIPWAESLELHIEKELEEVRDLLDILKNNKIETENFKLTIVKKKTPKIGGLHHDWIKIKEASSGDNDFRSKVMTFLKAQIIADGLKHDFIAEIEYLNEHFCKGRIKI